MEPTVDGAADRGRCHGRGDRTAGGLPRWPGRRANDHRDAQGRRRSRRRTWCACSSSLLQPAVRPDRDTLRRRQDRPCRDEDRARFGPCSDPVKMPGAPASRARMDVPAAPTPVRTVSRTFDPTAGGGSTASTSPTSPTTGRSAGRPDGDTGDLGTVRIAFDRPEVRNAFRPHTVDELYSSARPRPDDQRRRLRAAHRQRAEPAKDGGWAFCSGGDQRIRGRDGYRYADGRRRRDASIPARAGRLHILEVQRLIRFMPKVVIAVVPGWAAGGGHSLHVVCDLTLASAEHARFKQTDADVGILRRRLRLGLPGPDGRPEVRQGDLLPRPRVHRRADARDGRGQRGGAARRAGERRPSVGRRDQRQVADGAAHAQVRLQPGRRRSGRAATVRRRGDPARLRHRRGGRGSRLVPGRSGRPTSAAYPWAY